MYSKVYSATQTGMIGGLIEIETQIHRGLPYHVIVGLPSQTIRESKDRVKSAVRESGGLFPDNRITQNLYPAHLKKEGTHLDLPLAIGILACTESFEIDLGEMGFIGELSLEGKMKPVTGILALIETFHEFGIKKIVIPEAHIKDVIAIEDVQYYPYATLQELSNDLITGNMKLMKEKGKQIDTQRNQTKDYADTRGMNHVIRALTIGAVGRFNILLVGPPGCGKTMLAERLPSIMPDLNRAQYMEVSKIYGMSGETYDRWSRPFRMPHHSVTPTGMIGGTSKLIPGEISKAHEGVLFLDEILEFKNHVLQLLREPISAKEIHLVKNFQQMTFPCNFMLVATMNPCPCGYHLSKQQVCTCNAFEIKRYLNKMSGALLDRFHMIVYMDAIVNLDESKLVQGQKSADIRKTVEEIQRQKLTGTFKEPEFKSTEETQNLLASIKQKLGLSMRGYFQLIEVAKVIALLNQSERVGKAELYEAISYHNLSRLKEGV